MTLRIALTVVQEMLPTASVAALDRTSTVYWLETVASVAFAVGWLVKARHC
jgi:hypothetical protein